MFIARIAEALARGERNGLITTSNISLLRSFKVLWGVIGSINIRSLWDRNVVSILNEGINERVVKCFLMHFHV